MTDLATTDRTALTTEYVAGGVGLWSHTAVRTLPWAFDDLGRDFGDDIYERMQLDPQVIAVVNVLRAAIIEEGAQCRCSVEDPDGDGYELGQEIAAFCTSVLADLTIPLDDVLWDLLGAIALGNRVAEQVYQDVPATTYALPGGGPVSRTPDLIVLAALKPKPRRSTAFVVDAFMNVQGLVGQQPGQGYGAQAMTLMTATATALPNLLDRSRFAVLTFRPQNADPRGTTILRPAYTPWWVKQQIWPEFLKYLAQFASPSIYAIASEAASKSGVIITNPDGTTSKVSAVTVLLDTLLAFRNGTAAAFDYGTVLKALEVVGDGQAFHNGFARCDAQITIAVLNQTLATMEGEHQARASSEVHQDTLDTIQRQAKRAVCTMLRRDVLTPLVAYNYGWPTARALTPIVSLGSVESQDFAKVATAIALLARAGYLDASQYAGIDAQLNLPARAAQPATEPTEPDAVDEESPDEEDKDEIDKMEAADGQPV